MKKFISLLLTMTMFFTFCVPAYAVNDFDVSITNANGEISCLELTTDIGDIELTYKESTDGTLYMYEYHNGILYERTKYIRGNTYFERSFASDSRSSSWEMVDFSDAIEDSPAILAARNNIYDLGYMHYRNPLTLETLSISCYVSEAYNNGTTVTLRGTLGTLLEFTNFLVGALGLPAAIGSGVAASILYAGVVVYVGKILQAVFSTEVTANVTNQTIHGNSTTHAGKPEGIFTGSITYVTSDNSKYTGQYFYDGYTTHDWRTNDFGKRMFWKVYGVEYTPTSWSSDPY